ncbi:hypothetical protein [Sphingomonas sp. SCN 67-18]|nr:hypothetical protein [Sphingomonas sp. SCN 67-18]
MTQEARVRSYRDSDAYRRSQRYDNDGRAVFPLAFSDRPRKVVGQ